MTKLTPSQFTEQFKIRELKRGYECYGTWDGVNMTFSAGNEDDARIGMWEKLARMGWVQLERDLK